MKSKGFTLVEMMVVVVIFSLVALFLTNYLVSERKQHKAYELMIETRNNVLSALSTVAHDIRMLGSDPTLSEQFGLWYEDQSHAFRTDANRVIFTADINPVIGVTGDGSWNPALETFGFYLQGNTIFRPTVDIQRRWTPASDLPLVSGITNLTFTYRVWDEAGDSIMVVSNPTPAQIDDVLAIDVSITGQSRERLPTTGRFYTFTGQTRVTIRTKIDEMGG